MAARFGPACSIAADRERNACVRGVPSGRRKIQGMLVEVRARSEEMAIDGDERLHCDLFGKVTGRAVERDQRQDVILIDRLHQIVGSLAPREFGGNGDQREVACR